MQPQQKVQQMEVKNNWLAKNTGFSLQILQLLNLRPEESDRTLLMFAFYVTTSIGLRWSEDTTVALFLEQYQASDLPWIYVASAVLGTTLIFIYSWLRDRLSSRWIIVAVTPFMFTILFVLREGLHYPLVSVVTVFLLRLWVDASYVLNDLNVSIAAGKLFNIREIKRTYPLVSSGMLLADIISGFSLPLLISVVGLDRVIFPFASIFIIIGAVIMAYITRNYRQAFPRIRVSDKLTNRNFNHSNTRLHGPFRRYAIFLFTFFVLLQFVGVFIDFQYLTQLQVTYNNQEIATFLGIFGGVAGIFELLVQVFVSSRIIQRFGVFFAIGFLPAIVGILAPIIVIIFGSQFTQSQHIFWGLVLLKFLDELIRYTLILSGSPLLFQAIPEKLRTNVQAISNGIAESVGAGIAGLFILGTLWLSKHTNQIHDPTLMLLLQTTAIACACLGVIWLLRSLYLNLLVYIAKQGKFESNDVDFLSLKQAVDKALTQKNTAEDRIAYIELLSELHPDKAGNVLAPLLPKQEIYLQQLILEVMLQHDANPAFLDYVEPLISPSYQKDAPKVFALALRYIHLARPDSDLQDLEKYLDKSIYSTIRSTAAGLILRQGKTIQKNAAKKTLKKMLESEDEKERVNAVIALKEAVYLQELRIYIPNLLKDKSLRVRCAVLETIAAIRLEDYYSALIKGLKYKSTRMSAINALVKLENEVLQMLLRLASNEYQSQSVRLQAWRTIGQISTLEAVDILWKHLTESRGTTREHILTTLLRRHKISEDIIALDRFREQQIKNLIQEELKILGEIYAAHTDLQTQGEFYAEYIEFKTQDLIESQKHSKKVIARCRLLQKALLESEIDVKKRLLMMFKLLYSQDKIQAAIINIRSESSAKLARGLEILDRTLDLEMKSTVLHVLDRRSPQEKLYILAEEKIVEYQQMPISDRIHQLLGAENSISEWCLACCLHLCETARISLNTEQILKSISHPTGFVREAAIAYLKMASPRILYEILPQIKNDPHPLVLAQVNEFMKQQQIKMEDSDSDI
ncbi:MAG: MFS transporter [Cyanobacteria bacterium P01_A01_bin.45]